MAWTGITNPLSYLDCEIDHMRKRSARAGAELQKKRVQGESNCEARVLKNRALQILRLSRSAAPRKRSTSAAAAFQSMVAIFSLSLSTTHRVSMTGFCAFHGPN
jgi:hypothetical protein